MPERSPRTDLRVLRGIHLGEAEDAWEGDGMVLPDYIFVLAERCDTLEAALESTTEINHSLTERWNARVVEYAELREAAIAMRDTLLRGSPGWLDTPAGAYLIEVLGRAGV